MLLSPAKKPLIEICFNRYFVRTQRFMYAYRRGLSGKQAAWVSKKYHGHRVLPNSILDDLEKAGISRD